MRYKHLSISDLQEGWFRGVEEVGMGDIVGDVERDFFCLSCKSGSINPQKTLKGLALGTGLQGEGGSCNTVLFSTRTYRTKWKPMSSSMVKRG